MGDPGVLAAVGRGIFFADGGVGGIESVWDQGVEGEGNDLDGQEVALVLGDGEGQVEREEEGDERSHFRGGKLSFLVC